MAYAATGNTSPTEQRVISGRIWRTWSVTEAEASSASEFVISVPKHGTIWRVQYARVSGTSSTLRPTFRGATGAWAGSGSGSMRDITRVSAAAANGSELVAVPYYCPTGIMYVRTQGDSATTDGATAIEITIIEGAP